MNRTITAQFLLISLRTTDNKFGEKQQRVKCMDSAVGQCWVHITVCKSTRRLVKKKTKKHYIYKTHSTI